MKPQLPTMCEVKNFDKPYRVLRFADFSSNLEDIALHGTTRIYGRMLEVAFPIVEHFHSDLGHDCIQLHRKLHSYLWSLTNPHRRTLSPATLPLEFYWSLDDWGTFLIEGPWDKAYGRKFVFKLSIWVDSQRSGDSLMFKMERMEDSDAGN